MVPTAVQPGPFLALVQPRPGSTLCQLGPCFAILLIEARPNFSATLGPALVRLGLDLALVRRRLGPTLARPGLGPALVQSWLGRALYRLGAIDQGLALSVTKARC